MASSDFLKRLLDNWPAKVISLGLAILVVLLNDLASVTERSLSVQLELRLSENVVPSAEHPNRVRIRLRGDETRIFNVREDDIIAYADFREHEHEGVYRAPVVFERRGSALDLDVLEISVEPTHVTVALEEKLVRSMEIVPNITGFPPPGYELSDYRLSPTAVSVEGPRSRLADVPQILTEVISLSGRTADFSERVRLMRPDPLVTFPGGDVVDFRALITETVIQTTYDDVEIVVVDLDPDLSYVADRTTGAIRVQGKQLDLEGIPVGRIGLFVDAGAIGSPGVYTLPVRPLIPAGVLVLGIEPARIELTIDSALQTVVPPSGESVDDGADG